MSSQVQNTSPKSGDTRIPNEVDNIALHVILTLFWFQKAVIIYRWGGAKILVHGNGGRGKILMQSFRGGGKILVYGLREGG